MSVPARLAIVFASPPVRVQAEAGDADGADADGADAAAAPAGRRIEGTLLPYGVQGRASDGNLYLFEAGSITPLRERTPLLLGHDRNRPVGVLAELADSDQELRATFTVDGTADGDTALVQAQSGSRAALSVGASPTAYRIDESGAEPVVRVQAADLVDASLVCVSAFPGADVASVAAEAPEPMEGPIMPDTVNGVAATLEPAVPVELHAGHPRIALAERPRPAELGAGELAVLLIRAQRGETDARELIQAALTESISTDVSGLLPPVYERTVIGGRSVQRPLYAAFKHRPLPGVGLSVSKPKWTTFPVGGWAATVDADATSSKVTIGAQAVVPERWDWAGAFPWVVVQRSDPGLIDEVYGEAVNSFYLDVEAKIYAKLNAATAGTAVSLGAAVAEFYVAAKRSPDVILMAPDVWGKYADRAQLTTSVAIGSVSATGMTTSFGGIPAVTSGLLAAGQVILASDRAVDARITEPVQLTANAIGALNVEFAVVGEGLFDVDYPAELRKFAAVVPVTAAVAGASK